MRRPRRFAGTAALVALIAPVALAGAPAADAGPADSLPPQLRQDPIGEMRDVTDEWERYQPAGEFCVLPDGFDATTETVGDPGLVPFDECPEGYVYGHGTDPCRPAGSACLHRVTIDTPDLAHTTGLRRLFFDYATIPDNEPFAGLFYAHGHVYFRLDSDNESYTVDSRAHSPNVKNVTNDKLFVPDGSPWHDLSHGFDRRAKSYTGDTRFTHHSAVQGPYYVGPGYVNAAGDDIDGSYLDVQVMNELPDPDADNTIGYWAGFDSGEDLRVDEPPQEWDPFSCPTSSVPGLEDANVLYAGCADRFGHSDESVDPFA